jgi:hypothetical protein
MEVEYCWLEENLEEDNSNSRKYGRKQDGSESWSMFIPSNNVDSYRQICAVVWIPEIYIL